MSKHRSPLPLFFRNLINATRDPEIRGFGMFIAILLVVGTVFFAVIEGWTFLDSFYHSAMLITTIGASSMDPLTPIGKVFSVFYVFVGLGSVLGFVALFAGHIHGRPPKH